MSSVTVDYNIMLEYVYETNDDLIAFLNWLTDQPDVDQVNSRIILRIYKAQYPARIRN
jgi:Lrp/AsnC family transcriptional regulator for asnA, asnC and gidA